MKKMTIEDKLGLNLFHTDEENSHIEVDLEFVSGLNCSCSFGTLQYRKAHVDAVPVEDPGEALSDDAADAGSLDGDGGMLS